MQIIFLGNIKFYAKEVDKIQRAIKIVLGNNLQKYHFDLVFVWDEEEKEIFWDIYNDMIKFGIPLSQNNDIEVIKDKIQRAIQQKSSL